MSTQFPMDLLLLRNLLQNEMAIETPFWYLWDGDVSQLIGQLQAVCAELCSAEALAQESDSSFFSRLGKRRAFFCLDRLVPLDQSDMFIPFLGEPIIKALGLNNKTALSEILYAWPPALYAWARRLPTASRDQIITGLSANISALLEVAAQDADGFPHWPLADNSGVPLGWLAEKSWGRSAESAGAAWAETCPVDQAPSLLDGYLLFDHDPIISQCGSFVPHLLVEELVRKISQPALRLAVMVPFARLGHDFCGVVAERIVADLASVCPTHRDRLPETERWAWFQTLLRKRGFEEAADVLDKLVSMEESYWRTKAYEWPITFWIKGHDRSSWEPVYERLHDLEAAYPNSVIHHADALIPHDRLDLWGPILSMEQRGLRPLNAFCRWLPPEYRDILLEWNLTGDQDDDQDEAFCAYYAYLHRTPRPVLEWLWKRREALPAWRVVTLDRFLFAPPSLKPAAMMYDIQEVEADFRLEDPLNMRTI